MQKMRTFAAGLAVAVSLGAGAMTLAPAALAAPAAPVKAGAPAAPVKTGAFHTWRSAQAAAGFALRKPTRTHGLRRGPIVVTRCEVTGKLSKRNVTSNYGSPLHRALGLSQNNSGGACGNFGEARKLSTYRVQGRRATLWGVCGKNIGRPCSSRKIPLFLVWKKAGKYYVASSFNERRSTLVGFARSLRLV